MLETSHKTFDSFYLSDEMLRALRAVAYHAPTPAQVASIPLIMAGIDIIVQAQTGSGKTAAFAIPVIEMLEHHPGKVEVLVIVPTRELAKQVCEEFERLGAYKDLSATAIYGGTSYEPQFAALQTAQIVCATPGRLIDHLNRGTIDLSQLRVLCLDEADEMLSMGFRDDIEAVIRHLPEERQSLLFSATITEDIKALANRILFYPEFIALSTDSVATADVTHYYYNVRGVGRPRDLIKVLEFEEPDSAIIFCNTKDDTFTVTSFLKRHGYRADVLNGDLPQAEREKTLAALRAGRIDFIVATDVAARGIDISDLSHVINYALPESAEVYIHRTGRTGRAGKKGIAISLIAPTEVTTFFQVTKLYDVKMQKRELPTTEDIVTAKQGRALGRLGDQLGQLGKLPYGGKLGMAEQLLGSLPSNGEPAQLHQIKLVARLLALADRVLKGEPLSVAPNADAKKSAVSPVAPEPEPAHQTPASPAPVEAASEPVQLEEAAPLAPVVEAPVKEIQERPRRGASRRQEETRPAPAAERLQAEPAVAVEAEAAVEVEVEPLAQAQVAPAAPAEPIVDHERPKRVRTRRAHLANSATDATSPGEAVQAAPEAPARVTASQTEDAPAEAVEGEDESVSSSVMRKMYLNVGKERLGDAISIIDMICFMAGVDPEDIGEVTLENTYSYVQVRRDYFHDIIAALHQQEWEGATLTAQPARK
ncbi:MAG: DEAD/DEAH box helicase [Bradymonadaceae bacterium]|nr:DEAD/DEAH box helicase [Lujinxingiaceae bacterium]